VTSLNSYHGMKEVNGHDPVVIGSHGNPISGFIQDLSSGTTPAESLESELVRVVHATVSSVSGLDLTIAYGTALNVLLRVTDSSPFCLGATFDVTAPVSEWDGPTHRIQSFLAADFTNLDTSGCSGGGRTPVAGDLVLNEFLADPPALVAGDANCDTVRDGTSQEDEFIELVNVSADVLSLAGVTISDGVGVRHTFSISTSLEPGHVIVVFGGGTPSCTFWTSDVQAITASSGVLGLNNTGDTITVAVGSGATAVTLQTYTFGSEGGRDTSLTLSPDLNDTDATPTGVGPFVAHTTADTADGSAFSPGVRINGSPF
jgi:hypothetical protein